MNSPFGTRSGLGAGILPPSPAPCTIEVAPPQAPQSSDPTHVNIIILDDYQDAVRKLKCASVMEALNAKVFTNTVKGIGQLSVRTNAFSHSPTNTT